MHNPFSSPSITPPCLYPQTRYIMAVVLPAPASVTAAVGAAGVPNGSRWDLDASVGAKVIQPRGPGFLSCRAGIWSSQGVRSPRRYRQRNRTVPARRRLSGCLLKCLVSLIKLVFHMAALTMEQTKLSHSLPSTFRQLVMAPEMSILWLVY